VNVKRNFLVEIDDKGLENGPYINAVITTLKTLHENISTKELEDSDFVSEGPASVQLGRRMINLRRKKDNIIDVGSIVRLKLKDSPNMIVEAKKIEKVEEKTYDVIICSWFNNGSLCRTNFNSDVLEIVPDEIEQTVLTNNLPSNRTTVATIVQANPSIILALNGERKIEAIKILRSATGFGLKESKDLIESITPETLHNYNRGHFI